MLTYSAKTSGNFTPTEERKKLDVMNKEGDRDGERKSFTRAGLRVMSRIRGSVISLATVETERSFSTNESS